MRPNDKDESSETSSEDEGIEARIEALSDVTMKYDELRGGRGLDKESVDDSSVMEDDSVEELPRPPVGKNPKKRKLEEYKESMVPEPPASKRLQPAPGSALPDTKRARPGVNA